MKIGSYETHPAADLFPLMEGEEFDVLVKDIREHGQLEPCWRLWVEEREGVRKPLVLDGRNRLRACIKLGRQPEWRDFEGRSPTSFVVSMNRARRHLSKSQLATIAVDALPLYEAEAKERQLATLKQNAPVGETLPQREERAPKSTEKAGADFGVSGRYVQDAKKVHETDPVLFEAVKKGKVDLPAAVKLAKLDDQQRSEAVKRVIEDGCKPAEAVRKAKSDALTERTRALPEGKHRVIYADPPWKYNDSKALDGYESTSAENNYPTMTVDELCALDVKSLAADDSVLFCWATFPLLPEALQVVKAWGFKYKTAFVWAKGRANYGNYHNANAELLLVCTRGSGTPDVSERESQVQDVPHPGKHSAKPEVFREMIDRLYVDGPRVELFRRGDAPDGWTVWGNEAVEERDSDGA